MADRMEYQLSNEQDVLDPMDTDNEQSAKPAKPTITSGLCRDTISMAMLAFRQNKRTEMIDILLDLEFTHVLRPVYEAQVCYLIMKYAVSLDREQERDFATKVKIAANNIIYKEDLVSGSNAWQWYHDMEVEADDRLEIWEAEQREIDEQEFDLEGDDAYAFRVGGSAGEEAADGDARMAYAAGKARERQEVQRQRVLDSQATFYMTYEGHDKTKLRDITEDSIKTSIQPAAESDDEDLSDAEEFSEDELDEVRDSLVTSFNARRGYDNEQVISIPPEPSESEPEEETESEESESEEEEEKRQTAEERRRSDELFLREATGAFMEKNNLKAEWMEFVRNRWIAGALADAQDNNDDAGTGDGVPVVTSHETIPTPTPTFAANTPKDPSRDLDSGGAEDVVDNREPAQEAGSVREGKGTRTIDLTAAAAAEETEGEASARPARGIVGHSDDEDGFSFVSSRKMGKRKVEAEVDGEDTVGEEMIGKKMILVKRQKKN